MKFTVYSMKPWFLVAFFSCQPQLSYKHWKQQMNRSKFEATTSIFNSLQMRENVCLQSCDSFSLSIRIFLEEERRTGKVWYSGYDSFSLSLVEKVVKDIFSCHLV